MIVNYHYNNQIIMLLRIISKYPINSKLFYSFFNTKLTEQKLHELKMQYRLNPSLNVFMPFVEQTSDYFRMFKAIHETQYSHDVYKELSQKVKSIKPQTDNLILLRTKILTAIAEDYQKQKKYGEAHQMYSMAIDCIEHSRVPQIMLYYTLYRKYGLFLVEAGQASNAKEVLTESVKIIDQFVGQSEDPVSGKYNSIEQAKGALCLAQLDPENREQWIEIANKEWRHCQGQQYKFKQYAETVVENFIRQKQLNPKNLKKVRLLAEVQLEKMENQEECRQIREKFEGL